MLVFEERGKQKYPEKKFLEQSREPTNSAHLLRRVRESNLGHIGGRRVLYHCANPAFVWFESLLPCPHLQFKSNLTLLMPQMKGHWKMKVTIYLSGQMTTTLLFLKILIICPVRMLFRLLGVQGAMILLFPCSSI